MKIWLQCEGEEAPIEIPLDDLESEVSQINITPDASAPTGVNTYDADGYGHFERLRQEYGVKN